MTPAVMAEFQAAVVMSMTGKNLGAPTDKWWLPAPEGVALIGWSPAYLDHIGAGFGTVSLLPRSHTRMLIRYVAYLVDEGSWRPGWSVAVDVMDGEVATPVGANPQPIIWAGMPSLGAIRMDMAT